MTGRFLSRGTLQAATDNDDGLWRVVEPLVYESAHAARTITVPRDFITDLATVPRLPFVFIVFANRANEAAIVHDYLYATGLVPRRVADDVLLEACAAQRVARWRAWVMWVGVRMFGGAHFMRARH